MIEYIPDRELQQLVDQMVAGMAEFSAIRLRNVGVKAVLKLKTDGDGEPVVAQARPARLKKLDPLAKSFSAVDGAPTDYVLVVDSYAWTNFPDRRSPIVHGGLMAILVEEGPDGGTKLKTRKPDIVEFFQTFSRYGAWNSEFSELAQLLAGVESAAPLAAGQLLAERTAEEV